MFLSWTCLCMNLLQEAVTFASGRLCTLVEFLTIHFLHSNDGLLKELLRWSCFEAAILHSPSNIDPWSIIGDESSIHVLTDLTSCFERNKVDSANKHGILLDMVQILTLPV
ncbi:hypothetical protein Drorol1_Dr00021989 [Drosera rotundifolia]